MVKAFWCVHCPGDGLGNSKEGKEGRAVQAAHVAAAEVHCGGKGVATYDCPVCRKAQILDLDRLQVGRSLCDDAKT